MRQTKASFHYFLIHVLSHAPWTQQEAEGDVMGMFLQPADPKGPDLASFGQGSVSRCTNRLQVK